MEVVDPLHRKLAMSLFGWFRGSGKRRARRGRGKAEADQTKGEEQRAPKVFAEDADVLDQDISLLLEEVGTRGETVQREAEREIRTAAEESLKRLHAIKRGRCPVCGTLLRQHLAASICDSCGWHSFDAPRSGPVRVHLSNSDEPIEGERCYFLKSGEVLVIQNDVVRAKIPARSVSWAEYCWAEKDIHVRHQQIVERMSLRCDWCLKEADPEKEGFHLVHIALGANQSRYCFCSDECFQSFKHMYPSRVDRNCYERDCATCDLCIKRYEDDSEALRTLAKDYVSAGSLAGKAKGKIRTR